MNANVFSLSGLVLSAAFVLVGQNAGNAKGNLMDNRNEKELRERMVAEQIAARGVRDARVLAAMAEVPRSAFIPEENRALAYEDRPVAIGLGQTISQPYIVALMSEALKLREGQTVLEIGTGSGYQAAILAKMGAKVFTIEILPELAKSASENLRKAGFKSVKVKTGDGYRGWKEHAPFDRVIVTCAPNKIPQPLVDQLKEGGRLVIPVGEEMQIQELLILEKRGGKMDKEWTLPVRFVPMTGEAQKPQ